MLVPPFITKIACCPLKTYLHNNLILADSELLSVQKSLIGPQMLQLSIGNRSWKEWLQQVRKCEWAFINFQKIQMLRQMRLTSTCHEKIKFFIWNSLQTCTYVDSAQCSWMHSLPITKSVKVFFVPLVNLASSSHMNLLKLYWKKPCFTDMDRLWEHL